MLCTKFRGEHADAQELSALYISSGVPVYPLCRGYSYRTLTWRMSVEAQELSSADESSRPSKGTSGNERSRGGSFGVGGAGMPSGDASERENSFGIISEYREIGFPVLDKFYSGRDEGREVGGYYHSDLTYLEEKCLFWQHQHAEEESPDGPAFVERRRHSLTSSVALRPSTARRQSSTITQQDPRHSLSEHANLQTPRRTMSSNNLVLPACLSTRNGEIPRHRPLCSVRIHRHLADRHLLGHAAVTDDDGKMKTVSLCLGADFFHPHFSNASVFRSATLVSTTNLAGPRTVSPLDVGQSALLSRLEVDGTSTESDSSGRYMREDDAPQDSRAGTKLFFPVDHVAPDVELEVYSSASMGISKVQRIQASDRKGVEPCQKPRTKDNLPFLCLRSRIAFYQRKLDSHLAHYQSVAFDECLLDFWDEFFPSTKGVHFHDGHTPVPRMLDLRRFLTNPCPKSYGTIQCEIERIKTTSSRKGVGMKGKLFPSYQYRLFIRDRGGEDEQMSAADENNQNVSSCRNDTILMIAKNKDKQQKKASTSSGQSTSGSVGKRGVTNYYLYTPTDRDIQSHHAAVNNVPVLGNNSSRPCQRLFPEPAGRMTSREIGRLQSNFIGTEFQIFTPKPTKRLNRPASRGRSQSSKGYMYSRSSSFDSASGSEVEVASNFSQDTNSSLHSSPSRSSILGHNGLQSGLVIAKRSRSRRSSDVSGSSEDDDIPTSSVPFPFQQSRRRSWPSLRYSRRAIAHDSGDNHSGARDLFSQRQHTEEEVGAITYTANLLGNRPRIMDVCIPKISDEGIVSPAWKSHFDAALEMGLDESMISRFKQLQHCASQQDNFEGNGGQNNPEVGVQGMTPSDFGLLALQNRPPWWNAELGAFVLNFGGRVSVASVKNFQLCNRSNQDFVILQFGRIEGRHSFTMDFQHPLSATQAFAMQVSNYLFTTSFGFLSDFIKGVTLRSRTNLLFASFSFLPCSQCYI